MLSVLIIVAVLLVWSPSAVLGRDGMQPENIEWYEQASFKPIERVAVTITNSLDTTISNCPIVIYRADFPIQDLHELWVTVVDPALPPDGKPSRELLARQGTHQSREEKNGHYIFHQLDDLDKDGIWDELFFMIELGPSEVKRIYIYLGYNQRGWNPHYTHAGIGSYCRHLVPFWESEHVGWKLWYPTDCDVYGKRTSQLMSQNLYIYNLDGYGVPYEMGSDIMGVSSSFGAGGICVFEEPNFPDSVSRPRFTPVQAGGGAFNKGQISDTRYAFDVIVNGPLRSTIKVKTMNWNSATGGYSLEQYYTAYAHHSFSTCTVNFLDFKPGSEWARPGVGMKRNPNEQLSYIENGIAISIGPEEIRNPDDAEGLQKLSVDFVGTALVVKPAYDPEYHFIKKWGGNHVYRVSNFDDATYEYMLAAAWSEGSVFSDMAGFKRYVLLMAEVFINPPEMEIGLVERK